MYTYTQTKWGSRLLDLRFAHSETQISEAHASGGVGSSPQWLLHSETQRRCDGVGKQNPHRSDFAAARPTDLILSSSGYLLQAPSCPPPAAAASCPPPPRVSPSIPRCSHGTMLRCSCGDIPAPTITYRSRWYWSCPTSDISSALIFRFRRRCLMAVIALRFAVFVLPSVASFSTTPGWEFCSAVRWPSWCAPVAFPYRSSAARRCSTTHPCFFMIATSALAVSSCRSLGALHVSIIAVRSSLLLSALLICPLRCLAPVLRVVLSYQLFEWNSVRRFKKIWPFQSSKIDKFLMKRTIFSLKFSHKTHWGVSNLEKRAW